MMKYYLISVIGYNGDEVVAIVTPSFILASDAETARAIASKRIDDSYFDDRWSFRVKALEL